jgi:hypothetical protein
LVWSEAQLIALDTGSNVYFLDQKYNIIASYTISTPLIGFYKTNNNNLLILEEAALKLITPQAIVLKNEIFDVIENFTIKNDKLFILTNGKTITFEL